MSATPYLARFDGQILVPEAPLDAAPGAVFELRPQPSGSEDDWSAFLDGVEGAWVGDDMEEPADLPWESEEPVF